MKRSGLLRLATVAASCVLLGWTIFTFPILSRTASAERLAGRLISGVPAKADVIEGRLAEIDASTPSDPGRAATKRAEAIMRLALYEEAAASTRTDLADARLKSLQRSLREALHFIPSDPYLWLVLFSIENAAVGYRSDHLEYLRMSYRLGPHEGWISLKRNPVTLAMLPALDAELARDVLDEFAALVENDLHQEAAAIFANTNPANRDRILARLASVSEPNRRRFSQELAIRLPYVAVPGISREDQRPWKR